MEKINIAELLKDCPKGMELDCTMFDTAHFEQVTDDIDYPIKIRIDNTYVIHLTKEGFWNKHIAAKCVIFPKGKTTWEGFHRPFKDGDIVVTDAPYTDDLQLFIFKNKKENNTMSSCYLMLDGDELDLEEGMYYVTRLATEEEKQRLFKAIKDNGYSWNAETKTLEKLLKFKVGDRIRHKEKTSWICTIVRVEDRYYVNEHPTCYTIPFDKQTEYELVLDKFDINTLVPFDSKVLIRNDENQRWMPAFWGYKVVDGFITTSGWYKYCIPYKGNENLFKTNNDCDDFYKTWINE